MKKKKFYLNSLFRKKITLIATFSRDHFRIALLIEYMYIHSDAQILILRFYHKTCTIMFK